MNSCGEPITQVAPLRLVPRDSDQRIAKSFFDGYNTDMNEARLVKIETRLDHIESQLSGLKWWVAGTGVAIIAAVIALASYQASWFQHSIAQTEASTNQRITDYQQYAEKMMLRISEDARKADERASEANIKAEALRLAQEWQKAVPPSK